ncbi:MAG: hypothetical protein KGK07_16215 [Chloroflexota bacterium]|nr:hypothetical protein [Chloroflexota bacterium]
MSVSKKIAAEMRPNTQRTRSRLIQRPSPDKKRTLGLGAPINEMRIEAGMGAPGDLVEAIRASLNAPLYTMPVIEQVRWTMDGPLAADSVARNFGTEIDLFGSGKNPAGIAYVETTMAQTGQLQCNTLACAIGFHIEPDPIQFTVEGNAFSVTATGIPAPASPDVFTKNDFTNDCLFDHTKYTMHPALLEWGWWANYAAWHLVRGYDLRWKIGQHTNIMDEVLRHTAYMPPNAQEGSASSSEVDTAQFIRRVNNHYAELGAALNFLPINFLRLGSENQSAGVGGTNRGVFKPTRAFDKVGVTFGGGDLRSMLKGNSEFRSLTVPYLIERGIPIGLVAQTCDEVQAATMREYLAADYGYDSPLPPIISPAADIIDDYSNTAAHGPNELTLDAPNTPVLQQVYPTRAVYKGGDLKISLLIKGFEVDNDWVNTLNSNTILRNAVMAETGIAWAQP